MLLPAAPEGDLLPVITQLISPILAVERPELMLVVDFDVTATGSRGLRVLLLGFRRKLTALHGKRFDLDCIDARSKILKLFEQTGVTAARARLPA